MMAIQLHRATQDDGAMAGARARKPNKRQPPRNCDQCGRPQSIYRHRHEVRCFACQAKTPPSDWKRLREAQMSSLVVAS